MRFPIEIDVARPHSHNCTKHRRDRKFRSINTKDRNIIVCSGATCLLWIITVWSLGVSEIAEIDVTFVYVHESCGASHHSTVCTALRIEEKKNERGRKRTFKYQSKKVSCILLYGGMMAACGKYLHNALDHLPGAADQANRTKMRKNKLNYRL